MRFPNVMMLLLTFCISSPAAAGENASHELTDQQLTAVKEAVGGELKDQYSGVYEDVRASVDGVNLVHVCGYVNSKNTPGAYAGRLPFYVSIIPYDQPKQPKVFMRVVSSSEGIATQVHDICRSKGIALD